MYRGFSYTCTSKAFLFHFLVRTIKVLADFFFFFLFFLCLAAFKRGPSTGKRLSSGTGSASPSEQQKGSRERKSLN